MREMLTIWKCIEVALCKRRASASDVVSDPLADNSEPVYAKYASRPYAAADDAARSTDSSGPEDDADSFGWSDTESDGTDLMPNSELSDIDTYSEVDFSDAETSSTPYRARDPVRRLQQSHPITRLNPHAAPFVPEAAALQQLRNNQTEGVDNHTLGTLLQALSKLTPAEAGELRAFLDDHLASQEAACPSVIEFPAVPSADAPPPSSSQLCFQTDLSECLPVDCAEA